MTLTSTIEGTVVWFDRVAAVLLATITLIVFISATLRHVIGFPIPDAFDVSRLLLGCTLLWGLASGCFRGTHIQVDLLWEASPPAARRWMDIFANLCTFVAILVFAWMLFGKVQGVYAANEETFDLRLAVWPFYAVAWMGVAAASISSLARLYLVAIGREDAISSHNISAE